MSVVLGFNWPTGHDNTVAAIVDGKLVFATEEERYTRHRYSRGEAPINAFKQAFGYLKANFGIIPSDVTMFATNHDPSLYASSAHFQTFNYTLRRMKENGVKVRVSDITKSILSGINWLDFAKIFLKHIYRSLGYTFNNNSQIIPVAHHLSHAASAYYFSGYKNRATVLTIDGVGEKNCTAIWDVKNGVFHPILDMELKNGSIGMLYDGVSKLLGYKGLEGPGKLMGLAPYGHKTLKYTNNLMKYIKINNSDNESPYRFDSPPIWNCRNNWDACINSHDKLAAKIFPKISWNKNGPINTNAANVSYAIQDITEKLVLSIARWAKDNSSNTKVAVAGGVGLNAKANMELYNSKIFKDVFIFPAANDVGGPIGAAAYVYTHFMGQKMETRKIRNVYLGPEYSDDSIRDSLKKGKLKYEYVGNELSSIANLISRNKVVAWYQGRAELGPRALGNRSILANPSNKTLWKKVNEIKSREWWRPLAPSILATEQKKYLTNFAGNPFMVVMAKLSEYGSKNLPAISHIDCTTRPQTVKKTDNLNYYQLIKLFKELSGYGSLINTSFNLAGEPIVETPDDAIKSFGLGKFDAMYLQGWLVTK